MKPRYRLTIQPKYATRQSLAGDWVGVEKGTGYEFWGLRKYLPGDSFSHIDWKARARSGELYVREFLKDSAYTLMLLVDISASMGYGRKLALARDIAASLAFTALQQSNPCGLLLYADRVLGYHPPAATGTQYRRLLEVLDQARPVDCRQTRLQPALDRLTSQLTSCVGIILSDFYGSVGTSASLHGIAVGNRTPAHEIVALHLLEETEWRLPGLVGQVPLQDMETGALLTIDLSRNKTAERILQHRRSQLVRQLARAGIDSTVLVAGQDDIQQKINALFTRRLAARN